MKLRLETRHRLLVIATGGDAEDLDNCDEVGAVVGPQSADLTPAPDELPGSGARKRARALGFTNERTDR